MTTIALMRPFLTFILVLTTVALNATYSASESAGDGSDTFWTCDELTPDLCDLEVTETGNVPIRDGLSVKYWKYERPSSSSMTGNREDLGQEGIPLIIIHGGPAFTHNYMLPLRQQACRSTRRAVYLYDQAGCGESTLPSNITNVTTDLPFLLDKYYYATEELPKLIEYWGLERYHIVGNSWGTILGQYFALQSVRPEGLVSLTLSGPLSDGDLYEQSQWDQKVGNLGSLPTFVQERLKILEGQKSYDTEEYQSIAEVLTTFFTVRTAPAPDCWVAAESGVNMEIYVGMQGASEFTFGGTLAHFNTTPDLPSLEVPVLLTSGTFDTMRPPVVEAMYRSIPKVEWTVFQHSGHVSMIDDAKLMNDAVDHFLNRVEDAYWSGTEFVPNKDACGFPGCNDAKETSVLVGSAAQTSSSHNSEIVDESENDLRVWTAIVSSFVLGALVSFVITRRIVRVAALKDGYQSISN